MPGSGSARISPGDPHSSDPGTGSGDGQSIRPLTGWGGHTATTSEVVTPTTIAEIVDLEPRGSGQIARGLGRSHGDAAQLGGGTVIDMTKLTGIGLDDQRGVVTAKAGTSLGRILDFTVPLGWFLPVTPGTRHVTVGGAIAADIHGRNHHRDGSFCQHVESLELITGDGRTIVARPGSDVFKTTVGGMGLTGTIVKATFQLIPIETPWMTVDTTRAGDFLSVIQLLHETVKRSRYSAAWLDLTRHGKGRGVIVGADHAKADQIPRDAIRPGRTTPVALPRISHGIVSDLTVTVLNQIWYTRAPRRERGRLRSMRSFFHSLDLVADWRRLYGEEGFLQYQFVVPFGEENTLVEVAEALVATSTPVSRAVLSRLGATQRGHLSFPMPGWTLAVDMPRGEPDLMTILDECDERVAASGGRTYLATDSRLRSDAAGQMYSELSDWQAQRAHLDPGQRLKSDLSERLGLTG